MLWANLHLLFLLSLNPFATGWDGEESFCSGPDRRLYTTSELTLATVGL